MNAITLAPSAGRRRRSAVDHAVLIFAAVAALALSARTNLPLIPVPVTAQTLAVLLIGALLGPKRATTATLVYLGVGAAGAPVFAQGGGVAYLFGPTGGYLVGFVPAAWVAGTLIASTQGFRPVATIVAFTLSMAVLYTFGLAQLSVFIPSPGALMMAGLVPFLPGAALKVALACLVVARVRK